MKKYDFIITKDYESIYFFLKEAGFSENFIKNLKAVNEYACLRTLELLKEKFNIETKIDKDILNIVLPTENLPKVVKELAISDVEIKAVVPKSHTLEDIFFDATEGGKNENN